MDERRTDGMDVTLTILSNADGVPRTETKKYSKTSRLRSPSADTYAMIFPALLQEEKHTSGLCQAPEGRGNSLVSESRPVATE